MLDVIHRVKNFINFNKLILENDVVACALSGGADSIFMTYVLNKISYEMNFKIIGIHVNHMLRGEEAYEDELFVEKFCKHNNIEFKIYRVDVKEYSKKNKISIEMAGREVRYKIFEDLKKENIITKCTLAHHADDDVETILMRIFKGTGIKGIEGIKEIRENFYVRPILFLRRNSEIEKFLNINNIKFVVDKTNFSQNYLRNKLRLSIIPSINESFSMDITKNILNGLYQHTDEVTTSENGKASYYRGYANKTNVVYKYHHHKGDNPIKEDGILDNFYGTMRSRCNKFISLTCMKYKLHSFI